MSRYVRTFPDPIRFGINKGVLSGATEVVRDCIHIFDEVVDEIVLVGH